MAQWATMPDHMLAKCAEAQALRKAFPREMSGDYYVRDAEPTEQARGFKVSEDPQDLIKQLAEAPDRETKDLLAAKAAKLPAEHLDAAREAWTVAQDRINDQERNALKAKATAKAKATTKRGKAKKAPEPESTPEPGEHDYGPAPMTDAEVAAVEAGAQSGFGFGDKGGAK